MEHLLTQIIILTPDWLLTEPALIMIAVIIMLEVAIYFLPDVSEGA